MCADYSAASAASVSNTTGTGVFILLLLNLLIFVLDHKLHLPQIHRLYLDHVAPQWWQFITCSFCHASWAHLSSNTFLLYVFGKIVEEEEGIWGVWFTYIITAVGERQDISWLLLHIECPHSAAHCDAHASSLYIVQHCAGSTLCVTGSRYITNRQHFAMVSVQRQRHCQHRLVFDLLLHLLQAPALHLIFCNPRPASRLELLEQSLVCLLSVCWSSSVSIPKS